MTVFSGIANFQCFFALSPSSVKISGSDLHHVDFICRTNQFRIYATCHIGDAAENLLRERGYDLEVYPGPEAPPKS